MSADLLRRAAVKLREEAARAAMNGYMPAPWRPVYTDSESLTGIAGCAARAEDDHANQHACDDCVVIEAWQEGAAAHIALLHPPVALALADLIEEGLNYASMAHPERYPIYIKAVAAAHAVLREEAS